MKFLGAGFSSGSAQPQQEDCSDKRASDQTAGQFGGSCQNQTTCKCDGDACQGGHSCLRCRNRRTAPTNAQVTKQLVSLAAPVKIKPLVNVMGMLTRVVTVAAMAIEAKKDTAHLRIFPRWV